MTPSRQRRFKKQTSADLSAEHCDLLKEISRRTGIPVAHIVREAVDAELASWKGVLAGEPFVPAQVAVPDVPAATRRLAVYLEEDAYADLRAVSDRTGLLMRALFRRAIDRALQTRYAHVLGASLTAEES